MRTYGLVTECVRWQISTLSLGDEGAALAFLYCAVVINIAVTSNVTVSVFFIFTLLFRLLVQPMSSLMLREFFYYRISIREICLRYFYSVVPNFVSDKK